jgi:choline dehydrogenase-like flavoprotein
MPSLIRGHTNAPAIAIGEKAADLLKEEWRANPGRASVQAAANQVPDAPNPGSDPRAV